MTQYCSPNFQALKPWGCHLCPEFLKGVLVGLFVSITWWTEALEWVKASPCWKAPGLLSLTATAHDDVLCVTQLIDLRSTNATLLPVWSHPVTPAQTRRRKSASLPTLTSDPLLSSQSQSLPLLHRAQMSLPAFRHSRQSTNTCHFQTGCISPWQPSFLL